MRRPLAFSYRIVESLSYIMERETQISAVVSETTKELLERHVRATGVKKGYLVEQALRHHLQALQELPADVIVHPRLVVTRKSGATLLKEIEKAEPTEALRDLLRDGD
jgi:hypothetical protein